MDDDIVVEVPIIYDDFGVEYCVDYDGSDNEVFTSEYWLS